MDTSVIVEEILSHHGVKGMHWGIRRDRSSAVSIIDKKRKIKTTGGYGHPASADAIRSAKIGRIGQKSGLKALSDQELQDYSRRMNLEQNVKRLRYQQSNPGKKFVLTLLGQTGKNAASTAANEVATQQVRKRLIRMGALAAAAA